MNGKFVIKRLGQAIIVLFAAYSVAFLLLNALPGDAVMARYASPEMGLSPEQIAQIRQQYGADDPIWSRYFGGLWGLLSGDWGNSLKSGASVTSLLAQALPATLTLALCGIVAALILAFALALAATYGGQSWIRNLARNLPPAMVSIPVFWLAIVLIQVFSFQLGWVPVIGAGSVQALILPTIALSIPIAAPLAQVLITSIDQVNEEPFIIVVQARGAKPSWVLWRNVIKNATVPVLTMAGLLFAELFSSAVVTEAVFGRSGLGTLTIDAVASRDTPVLLAIVVVAALVFVVTNLIVDLTYPLIDRRLKQEATA